ncbi:NUDIX hydrolase domain [Trinorchestia longiramus]|nr:NUDIX hydrolase domain [Trinorchestia longiramus]
MVNISSLVRKLYTLTIIRQQEYLLLGLKKRGFGQNKINGFGGKVEPGESIRGAAVREVLEESGVDVSATITKVGFLEFTFTGEDFLMEVHVFLADGFSGQPQESDEMRPEWFPLTSLPYERMWADDHLWYPLLLKGACFKGYFHFKGEDTILEHNLNVVPRDELERLVGGATNSV